MAAALDDLLTDSPPSNGIDHLLTDAPPTHDDLLSDAPPARVASEGAFGSFFRPIASNIIPSLATAVGGLGAGALAGETGPGAIAADIAGGTAAGAGAQALQNKILGEPAVQQMQAQEQANLAEHPFWAKMGTLIGQLPAVLGGGARFAKEAATTALGRAGESAVLGARMGGSSAAQQEVSGNQDVSIPEEIVKGALTFGPTGLLGPAKSLLGAVGVKAPTDAALMATSNALYDKVVHGKDVDATALSQQIGADVPGFAILNALTHGLGHLPAKGAPEGQVAPLTPEIPVNAPESTPEAQITPPVEAIPPEAKVVVPLAIDTASKLRELDPNSPTAEAMEQTAHESAVHVAETLGKQPDETNATTNAGQVVEGQQQSPAPIESQPEVSQEPPQEVKNPQTLKTQVTEWDQKNRGVRADEWFEGANINPEAQEGFAEAAANGGFDLQAHGMAKEATLTGGVRNLLNLLTNGLDPNRRGGKLDTANLVPKKDNGGAGGATASGAAYNDGPFMLVAKRGVQQISDVSQIGGVLVNEAHGHITDALRDEIHKIRPDLVVESYSKAGELVKQIKEPITLEENATLPESSAGEILQRQPEQVGEAGGERGGMEQEQQGIEAPEPQPYQEPSPPQATPEVGAEEEFSAKNAAVNDLLAKNDLPAAEKLASRNLTEEGAQADARYKADPASSFASADALVQRQLDDPQHQITPAEQAVLAAHGRALDAGLTHLSERSTDRTITPEERESARVQYLALRDKLSEYGQANTFAGTQPALVLRARQIEKAKDMTLGRLLADMNAIKGDKGITPEEDAKIREIAKRDADLQKQKAEAAAKESKSDLVNETDATRKAVEKDVRRGKKKRLTTDQKKNLLDTIFGRKPKGEDNQIQSSTPSDEGGAPVVTIQHSNAAVENLKKTEAGRKILSDAIIVPDWQRVIAHPAFDGRNFSTSERETIKKSEGFFDPQTGKSVVIRDNIRSKNGESPQRAVQRVLIHERVGHDGLTALRGLDPKFDKQWHDITSKIPQAELDEIGKTYSKLDRDGLINEWFARKFEALDPNEIPNPSTPFGRMWQAVKDLLAKIFGQSSKLDQQVRDLFRAAIHSSQAMESRRGFGDVMASLPEGEKSEGKAPSSIHEVPKSVLDRLMYEHVASGGLDPGERGVQELTNRMRADLEPYLGPIPEDEMQKAIVDYGKKVYPTKDEVAKEVSQRKQEILLGQQVKEAKGGVIPALRALRQKGTQHARDLLKELNETIAEKGLSRKSADEQRATRLDAKKSRIENSIQDVEKQISDLKENKPPKERKLPDIGTDEKLAELEDKLKGLRADRDQIVKDRLQPAPEPGDYFQKISKQVEASEKRIKELTAKNNSGDLSVEKSEKGPTHPLLEEKRGEVRRLSKELSDKRAARDKPARDAEKAQNDLDDAEAKAIQLEAKLQSGDLSKNPVKHKEVSSELQSVRDQIKGLNKGISDARKDAEKPAREAKAAAKELQDAKDKVSELEGKLARGEIAPEERTKRTIPAELQAERDKLSELNKEKADAWRELNSNTPITEEAAKKAVDSLLKRKQDRLKELQDFNRGIESGQTPERPAKRIPLKNRESERLDMEIKRNREKKEDYFRKKEYAERPTAQKFWDGVVKMKRALVLSSYGVFGKLAAAAHIRALLMGIEDLMGGGLEKILPKGVTSKARIESGSSVSAMANAAYEALTQGMKDAVKTIKTGQSDLDIQHGKLKGLDEGVSSWLGRLHGAVKAPIKRAAYEYAYKKQFENYGKHDPAALDDPMTQLKIQADAYKYANRAIFMQDNALTKAFSLFLNNLHQQGGGAAGIARALRVLLPIVKVPTNIAHEVYLNAFGVPLGLAKLGKAWKAGFDNLSTEDADMILSHLKKGSIGGAVMLMGFFNPQIAGGYYQRGIKRKDSDPEYGGFEINGVKIPRWMTHAPVFEAMQIGATMRRVAESRNHGEERGLGSGALAGLFGLASEVPFVNEMVKAGDLQSPEGREKWLGDVAKSQVIPAAVDQYARQKDVNLQGEPIKREPRNFTETLKTGIPGLREQVPQKKQKPLPKTP